MRPAARRGLLPGLGVPAGLALLLAALRASPLPAQALALGGGIYLFHYRPLDLAGAEPHTEVYAAFATLDLRRGPWRVHLQARARDTKLRSFFPGNVWFQEAWASVSLTPEGPKRDLRLRAGKVYQLLGRFWDGSFFGNIHYFDGLKLNPQFGVEAEGRVPAGPGSLVLRAQYVLASDRVSGALPGRDFETDEELGERDGWAFRGTAALPGGLTVGASFLRRVVRGSGGGGQAVDHVALDAEWRAPPLTGYVEWTRRDGEGLAPALRRRLPGADADYWLVGAQVDLGRVRARYNFSRARYTTPDRVETIHQPGVTVEVGEGVYALVEVDVWRVLSPGGRRLADRSLDLVLLLEF